MTLEDEVEAVARAICAVGGTDPDRIGTCTGKPMWMLDQDRARAAISAMNQIRSTDHE